MSGLFGKIVDDIQAEVARVERVLLGGQWRNEIEARQLVAERRAYLKSLDLIRQTGKRDPESLADD